MKQTSKTVRVGGKEITFVSTEHAAYYEISIGASELESLKNTQQVAELLWPIHQAYMEKHHPILWKFRKMKQGIVDALTKRKPPV